MWFSTCDLAHGSQGARRVRLDNVTRPIVVVAIFVVACSTKLDVPTGARVTCGSDTDCFNGQRCLLDVRLCVDATQSCVIEREAGFSSVINGTSCTQRSGASGVCLDGQCLTSSCGDGYVDPSAAEECDDGIFNSDSTPNACRTTCRDAGCGDGVVDDGKEVCDDGNTASGDGCRADCKKIEVCNDAEVDANEACDDANDNPNDGCDRCAATTWNPTVVVGGGAYGATPESATFAGLAGLVADLERRVYASDFITCRIVLIDRLNDTVTTVAGSGNCGGSGALNGEIARGTDIGNVRALALDPVGALYFADGVYIRRVDPVTGRLTVIAGNGSVCTSPGTNCPSGGIATGMPMAPVRDLGFDAAGNLFYSDSSHVLRLIPAGQSLSYVVVGALFAPGNTLVSGEPGVDARLNEPAGITVDPDGMVYVLDSGNHRIVRYDVQADTAHVFAGTGAPAVSADGSIAAASPIQVPGNGADLDRRVTGEVIFTEQNRVRMVDLAGRLVTLAGTGGTGSSGDGGPPLAANMMPIKLAAIDGGGLAFTEESGNGASARVKIRVIENGVVSEVAASPPFAGLIVGKGFTSTALPGMKSFDLAANGDIFITHSSPNAVLRANRATGLIERVAGGGTQTLPNGIPATDASFTLLTTLRVRPNGDLVVVDSYGHAIYRIDGTTNVITRIGGTGTPGFSGEGGLATSAQLNQPCDVDFASGGDMYILDCGNRRIRRVDSVSGTINTFAGDGTACATATCGDGAAPTAAQLGTVDPQFQRGTIRVLGNGETVLFSDRGTQRVRKISGGTIQTIAGGGSPPSCATAYETCGDGGAGTSARFQALGGIALDGAGLLIADQRLRRLDSLDAGATIRAVAVNASTFRGDGGPALTAGSVGSATVQRATDGIYLGGSGPVNGTQTIRKIVDGNIATIVGLVDAVGDGPAASGDFTHPGGLTAIANNLWLVADGEPGRVRLFDDATLRVSTVVGYPNGFVESLLPSARARYLQLLFNPTGVAYDAAHQTVYVVEEGLERIRALSVAGASDGWTVSTFAGSLGLGSDDGPLASATFNAPVGITYDATRDVLWVADAGNHVVRRIDMVRGEVSTLAGRTRLRGFAGDGRAAGEAYFTFPSAVAVCPVDGSLYIADTGNNRVRRVIAEASGDVSSDSIVETVLGDGTPSGAGSGTPARAFAAQAPLGLAFDSYGDLLVTSTTSVRIVNAGADGVPTGEDTVQTIYGIPPRDTFPENVTKCLTGVAPLAGDAAMYVLDGCLGYLLRLDRQALP